MNKSRIEVLAPAGSPECIMAAVRCGAAAVYLGVEQFNARRSAHNFTPEALREAVSYCHARGVAVHVTLNTLIREDEMEAALRTAAEVAEVGVDALIVQDVGLARRLHTVMPQMPLHASTQLSCHTPSGVKLLRDAGFSRVVLAREMTREEIAACANLGVELEVFVHGALCMSVSGQCYFSAMLGGRSGNRGACAQTCRLPFEPAGERVRPCPPDRAALSLRDNCLVDYVQDMIRLGITSLKIEGRMKRPEYVAAASAVYSKAARGEATSPEALEQLKKVFSRTGFTDGYYTNHRGSDMFGVRRREDVTAAADVLKTLAHTYDKEQPLVGVTMEFTADSTESRLTVTDEDGRTVVATGEGVQTAIQRSSDPERVVAQLHKTGGTPFSVQKATCCLPPDTMLPLSVVNALRRQALEQLLSERGTLHPVPCDLTALPPALPDTAATPMQRIARLSSAAQWSSQLQADAVIFPLDTPSEFLRPVTDSCTPCGIEIPRGMFGQENAIRRRLKAAREAGATFALCGNIGAIPLAIEAGLAPVGGFGLNLTNREALAFYASLGLRAATLSMELTFAQMAPLKTAPLPVGIMVYGHQPLMLTRNCPRRCALGSCQDCGHKGISDRTGTRFPVMCAGGCSEVLNSVPLYWGDRPQDIPPVSFQLFHFTIETAQQAASILHTYRHGGKPPATITRGLYRRGVE